MRVFFVSIAVAACASTNDVEVSRKNCERYLDHVVDLRLRDANEPVAEVRQHRAAMKNALGKRFVASCEQLTPEQLSCGLRATDSASAARCTQILSK
jgi:hypothetical protein